MILPDYVLCPGSEFLPRLFLRLGELAQAYLGQGYLLGDLINFVILIEFSTDDFLENFLGLETCERVQRIAVCSVNEGIIRRNVLRVYHRLTRWRNCRLWFSVLKRVTLDNILEHSRELVQNRRVTQPDDQQ